MKKVLILTILLTALTGCFGKNSDKKNNSTKNEKIEIKEKDVIENKDYSGIKIENIKFIYDGEYTTMSFTIINSRNEDITLGRYDVLVKDANNNEIGRFEGFSRENIAQGKMFDFALSIDKDYSKAKSVEFNFIDLNTSAEQ